MLTPDMPLLLKEMGINYDPEKLNAALAQSWPQVYSRAVQVRPCGSGLPDAFRRGAVWEEGMLGGQVGGPPCVACMGARRRWQVAGCCPGQVHV